MGFLRCAVVGLVLVFTEGLKLRSQTNSELRRYTCPPRALFRNDTQIEFFTSKRQPGDSSWPKIFAEVPKTSEEFLCGLNYRSLPAGCGLSCGYLYQWEEPAVRTFWPRLMNFTADFVFLDKFKSVLNIESRTAQSGTPAVSADKVMYTLVVPSGSLANLTVQTGDPLMISDRPGMITGGYALLGDDSLAFHN